MKVTADSGKLEYGMDLYKAIRELQEEKQRLDQVIASLEQLAGAAPAPELVSSKKRRGRKSMSSDERRTVSDRMKKYWESRRNPKAQAQPAGQ